MEDNQCINFLLMFTTSETTVFAVVGIESIVYYMVKIK